MTVRAELVVPEEPVPPGESLTVHLHVWNEGRIVDAYDLELLGPPAEWDKDGGSLGQLPVYPGNHEKINIPLAVPRDGELRPGALPFAVRVASTENPEVVAVPEAAVIVGEFRDVELEPVRSRTTGALWANNLVVLRNTGNVALTLRLKSAPEQPDAPLRTRLRRSRLALAPGDKARVALAVRVRPPVWVGAPAQWRVTTSAAWGEGDQAHSTDFVHRQRALLSKAAFKALTALTALLIAAAVLWFSPIGKKTPTAKTESAPGLSQADAVEQKEKKAAAQEKKQKEKAEREEEEEGAPRKKTLQKALFVDSKSKALTDRYQVPKGYRLVFKTAQITASGTETSTLLLKAAGKPLASMSTQKAEDVTPKSPVVVKAGDTVTLALDCKAPPPPADGERPGDNGAGSGGAGSGEKESGRPGPADPAACTATALLSGELVPLDGPFSEPDPTRPSGS
ncbi:hypothetical protein [Streptomyces sp. NPDC059009]|uniref:COG1470 family protein n=1 Tax=Streptomyces sp. NPDC059009 TaxID=3346694 RepID=UPI0036984A94